jgi:hypothetical protein
MLAESSQDIIINKKCKEICFPYYTDVASAPAGSAGQAEGHSCRNLIKTTRIVTLRGAEGHSIPPFSWTSMG